MVLKEHFVLSVSVKMFKIQGVNVWTSSRSHSKTLPKMCHRKTNGLLNFKMSGISLMDTCSEKNKWDEIVCLNTNS